MGPAQELAELLDREHEAARRADVDALLELQEAKRGLLQTLAAGALGDQALADLTQRANDNILLMRQLVECLRGLASLGATETYSPLGQRLDKALGHGRGTL